MTDAKLVERPIARCALPPALGLLGMPSVLQTR